MPGYILHLLHGKMFLEQYSRSFSDTEKKQYAMGLLMPDSNKANKIREDHSHFFAPEQAGQILQYPDLKRFPYYEQINEPFVLGYAAHLYLDRYFFSDFFLRYVRFLDHEKRETLTESEVEYAELKQSGQCLTVQQLFSEDYLYGDYTMLNRFIVDKYGIEPVAKVPVDHPVREVDTANFEAVQIQLDRFLAESTGSTEMHVFAIGALEDAIAQYAYGFGQWVDGINCVLQKHIKGV